MPTLALIFHLIDIADGAPGGPVSLQAAEKAAAFCEYLESHARRVYGLVTDIVQQAAAALAKKIQGGKLDDGFNHRDVQRKGWHLLSSNKLAQPACEELIEAGRGTSWKEWRGKKASAKLSYQPETKNI